MHWLDADLGGDGPRAVGGVFWVRAAYHLMIICTCILVREDRSARASSRRARPSTATSTPLTTIRGTDMLYVKQIFFKRDEGRRVGAEDGRKCSSSPSSRWRRKVHFPLSSAVGRTSSTRQRRSRATLGWPNITINHP